MRFISLPALLVANLVPLLGVLLADWDVNAIIVIYWSENLIIGFYNIFRMLLAKKRTPGGETMHYVRVTGNKTIRKDYTNANTKLFLVPFFIMHFGIFTLVHGLFVFLLFSSPDLNFVAIAISFVSLFVSHGLSFVFNFVLSKEYERVSARKQLFAPYSRVMIMHLTIIFGAAIVLQFESPLLLIILMIVMKIAVDLWSHYREHKGLGTF